MSPPSLWIVPKNYTITAGHRQYRVVCEPRPFTCRHPVDNWVA